VHPPSVFEEVIVRVLAPIDEPLHARAIAVRNRSTPSRRRLAPRDHPCAEQRHSAPFLRDRDLRPL